MTVVKKLYADGKIEECNEEMTLEEMQKFVGGYIESIAANLEMGALIVNEDGLMMDLPRNPNATTLVRSGVRVQDDIRGNALLVRVGPEDLA